MDAIYTATAHATGDGRNGHATSDDGILDLDLRIPKEMGGPGGATNPEQLFAAGYAACFHSALKVVAGRDKLDVTGTEVSASVGIGTQRQRRVRSPGRARRPRAGARPGDGRGARRQGPRGVPLLQRHPRQRRGHAQRRLTVSASARQTLRSVPSPEIDVSTTCPSARKRGGVRPAPTPPGVPVAMTSPGSSVITVDR